MRELKRKSVPGKQPSNPPGIIVTPVVHSLMFLRSHEHLDVVFDCDLPIKHRIQRPVLQIPETHAKEIRTGHYQKTARGKDACPLVECSICLGKRQMFDHMMMLDQVDRTFIKVAQIGSIHLPIGLWSEQITVDQARYACASGPQMQTRS